MYGNASVSELYNYNSSSGNVILLAIWVALFIVIFIYPLRRRYT